jgi:hypothetical protein
VNALEIRHAVALAACAGLILLAVACGGSSAPGGGDRTGDADALLANLHQELDDAYVALGKPPLDWDNVSGVKDRAFETLTSDNTQMMSGASWSLSVLDDHVAVYVNVDGVERESDWRP